MNLNRRQSSFLDGEKFPLEGRAFSKSYVIVSAIVLCALVIFTLWISRDGNHYWHDIRFLYATLRFSLQEILSGTFNPHQLGGIIDEVSAGGFYLAKVGHLWFLQLLYRAIPPTEGGLVVSEWFSILAMCCSSLMCFQVYSRLLGNREQAWLAACCFMVAPITPYLAGKLLSEVTALFLVTISIWALTMAFGQPKPNGASYAVVSALFLLLAALARLDIVLCFMGLYVALIISSEKKGERLRLLQWGWIISCIFIVGYFGIIHILGMRSEALTRYYFSFVRAGIKSNLMSLLGIATFGGMVYLGVFTAIYHQNRKKLKLLVIWFLIPAGSSVLITSNYMVEPRYMVPALLPLAGLGGLGFEVLLKKVYSLPHKGLLIGALVSAILIFNAVAVRLMPYELNRPSILGAVNRILELDPKSAILTPWAYTDFHFLHVMKPEIPVYNVYSPSHNGKTLLLEKTWHERLNNWYGENYIGTPAKLISILETAPVYYLGWRKYPPAENVKKILEFCGLKALSNLVDNLPLTDHLTQSWVWQFPGVRFEPVGKIGQYEYYRLTKRKTD